MRAVVRSFGRDLRGALGDDVRSCGLSQGPPGPPVTDAELAPLPAVVQRYLRAMRIVGLPRDRSFTAHLRGSFRLRPGQRFMPAETWQCNTVEPLARLFHMRNDFAGFVPMIGRDAYVSGHGSMRGKLLGVVTVANGSGDEFDTGELTTWLNDAVLMCPSTLLIPAVRFTAVDDSSFDVSCTDATRTVTARVLLDANAHPRDFRTTDRFADLPGGLRRAEWSTPIAGWRGAGGRRFPTHASAVWKLDDGDLTYLEFAFDDDAIIYNPTLVPTRSEPTRR